jgi:hypothetical protein
MRTRFDDFMLQSTIAPEAADFNAVPCGPAMT